MTKPVITAHLKQTVDFHSFFTSVAPFSSPSGLLFSSYLMLCILVTASNTGSIGES